METSNVLYSLSTMLEEHIAPGFLHYCAEWSSLVNVAYHRQQSLAYVKDWMRTHVVSQYDPLRYATRNDHQIFPSTRDLLLTQNEVQSSSPIYNAGASENSHGASFSSSSLSHIHSPSLSNSWVDSHSPQSTTGLAFSTVPPPSSTSLVRRHRQSSHSHPQLQWQQPVPSERPNPHLDESMEMMRIFLSSPTLYPMIGSLNQMENLSTVLRDSQSVFGEEEDTLSGQDIKSCYSPDSDFSQQRRPPSVSAHRRGRPSVTSAGFTASRRTIVEDVLFGVEPLKNDLFPHLTEGSLPLESTYPHPKSAVPFSSSLSYVVLLKPRARALFWRTDPEIEAVQSHLSTTLYAFLLEIYRDSSSSFWRSISPQKESYLFAFLYIHLISLYLHAFETMTITLQKNSTFLSFLQNLHSSLLNKRKLKRIHREFMQLFWIIHNQRKNALSKIQHSFLKARSGSEKGNVSNHNLITSEPELQELLDDWRPSLADLQQVMEAHERRKRKAFLLRYVGIPVISLSLLYLSRLFYKELYRNYLYHSSYADDFD